jgi:hypothetical protein
MKLSLNKLCVTAVITGGIIALSGVVDTNLLGGHSFGHEVEYREIQLNFNVINGELIEAYSANQNENLVINTKIEMKGTTEETILQNASNVVDFIINQGAAQFEEIRYSAIAEIDGEPVKIINFKLDRELIDKIVAKTLLEDDLIENAIDVWVSPILNEKQ